MNNIVICKLTIIMQYLLFKILSVHLPIWCTARVGKKPTLFREFHRPYARSERMPLFLKSLC